MVLTVPSVVLPLLLSTLKRLTIKGRRHTEKRGVMFKSLNTRAVHLELLTSLDSDAFLPALRRLIARQGKHRGTNFCGAT